MRLTERWSARGIQGAFRPAVALAAYAAGVLVASVFFNGLAEGDKADLAARAGASLAAAPVAPQGWARVAGRLAMLDLKVVLAVWLGSLLPGGRLLVLLALLFRGTVTGFAVAFLFWRGGLAGLALAVPVIMVPALVQVPALAWMGSLALAGPLRRQSLSLRQRLLLIGAQALLLMPSATVLAAGDGAQALALLLLRERLAAFLAAP